MWWVQWRKCLERIGQVVKLNVSIQLLQPLFDQNASTGRVLSYETNEDLFESWGGTAYKDKHAKEKYKIS